MKGKRFLAVWLVFCMLLGVLPSGFALEAQAANYVSYEPASTYYKNSKYYTQLSKVQLTGDKRTDIVNIAKSQLGYHEGNKMSELDGSNTKGTLNYTEYMEKFNKPLQAQWWCAAFVSWCAQTAGLSNAQFYKSAACTYMKNHMLNFTRDSYSPQKGDIVFFKGTAAGKSGHLVFRS